MEVKATDVSKALRKHVRPLLVGAGFDDATGRKFWRRANEKIDHVEISSLSSYRALTDNSTTASFQVRLGISLPRYGIRFDPFHRDYIKEGPQGPRPSESSMPIRGVICPPESPPMRKGRWGWEYNSLWKVNAVEDAEEVAIALKQQFETFVLDWLQQDYDLSTILELLQSDGKKLVLTSAQDGSHLWLDAEMPGSKIRQAHIEMARNALAHRV